MTKVPDDFSLAWVDAAWKEYGDYIMLREEDNVLILPPNRVYHVNPTGARIRAHLAPKVYAATIPPRHWRTWPPRYMPRPFCPATGMPI